MMPTITIAIKGKEEVSVVPLDGITYKPQVEENFSEVTLHLSDPININVTIEMTIPEWESLKAFIDSSFKINPPGRND